MGTCFNFSCPKLLMLEFSKCSYSEMTSICLKNVSNRHIKAIYSSYIINHIYMDPSTGFISINWPGNTVSPANTGERGLSTALIGTNNKYWIDSKQ